MPAPARESAIDLVDEHDNVVGQVQRGSVFEERANFRVAHILIFDGPNRVLLQQLGKGRLRHPLRWGSSVAAYLWSGEEYEDAAKRRLSEELGVTGSFTDFTRTWMEDEGCKKFIGIFTTSLNNLSTTPGLTDSKHIEELAWWKIREIEERMSSDELVFTPTFVHLFNFLTLGRRQDEPW